LNSGESPRGQVSTINFRKMIRTDDFIFDDVGSISQVRYIDVAEIATVELENNSGQKR